MPIRSDLQRMLSERNVSAERISAQFARDLQRIARQITTDLEDLLRGIVADGRITPDEEVQIEAAQNVRALLDEAGLSSALDRVDEETLALLDAMQEQARKTGTLGEAFAAASPDQLAAMMDLQRDQFADMAEAHVRAIVFQLRRVILSGARFDDAVEALEARVDLPGNAETTLNTAILDTNQSALNASTQDLSPTGYVYLGPDDALARPFCAAIVGKAFDRDQISRLDNGQLGDVFTTRGGYNCRHSWLPLFGSEQMGEFPRADEGDILAANVGGA